MLAPGEPKPTITDGWVPELTITYWLVPVLTITVLALSKIDEYDGSVQT